MGLESKIEKLSVAFGRQLVEAFRASLADEIRRAADGHRGKNGHASARSRSKLAGQNALGASRNTGVTTSNRGATAGSEATVASSILMPKDIKDEVLTVLRRRTSPGKGRRPHFVTAYQILARLPRTTRSRLIAQRGRAGRGSGQHYAAASVVAGACRSLERDGLAETAYWDTRGSEFNIAGQTGAIPSFPVCGLYRAK